MNKKMTLEEANSKLEKLVNELESGELGLEESMKKYEEAFNLLSFCYEQLETCKGQIIDINKRIDDIKNNEELSDE